MYFGLIHSCFWCDTSLGPVRITSCWLFTCLLYYSCLVCCIICGGLATTLSIFESFNPDARNLLRHLFTTILVTPFLSWFHPGFYLQGNTRWFVIATHNDYQACENGSSIITQSFLRLLLLFFEILLPYPGIAFLTRNPLNAPLAN